jgi:hypothetical protein
MDAEIKHAEADAAWMLFCAKGDAYADGVPWEILIAVFSSRSCGNHAVTPRGFPPTVRAGMMGTNQK